MTLNQIECALERHTESDRCQQVCDKLFNEFTYISDDDDRHSKYKFGLFSVCLLKISKEEYGGDDFKFMVDWWRSSG